MDPIQTLLLQANKKASSFPPTSRYAQTETNILAKPGKDPVIYLKRRFVPPPGEFSTIQEHIVQPGDRLDNIAHQYLGNPELFWQICDANGVMRPQEITADINRSIRITMPHGLSGSLL